MINKLSKFEILLFVIGVLVFNSFGQNKCNLQISIYEFKEDGSAEQFPVRNAKIKLVNSKTKKSLKISKDADIQTFTNVSDGVYEITVLKDNFQKTLKKISVDCSVVNTETTISEIVFLWKGNPKQTVKMYDSVFSLGAKDEAQNAETEKEFPNNKIVNGKAVLLVKPDYPSAARAVRAAGTVNIQITINELGYVISSKAISGHPLLRAAAINAAKESKFSPTIFNGIPAKVTGIVVYNFVP